MAVISVANPKGGAGKTTLALVLAMGFSKSSSVAVIDADPNRIIGRWAEKRISAKRETPFTIVEAPKEKDLISTIAALESENDFVIIDLEGSASRMTTRAIVKSHLVLIPMNPSPVDAEMAAAAVSLISEEEEMLERRIPFRMVMSRTPAAFDSRSMKRILAEIDEAGLPVIPTRFNEMAAFRDIFEYGAMVDELDPATTSSLDRAKSLVDGLTGSVLSALEEEYADGEVG